MSGRTSGTEHIRDKRDSSQEDAVGSEPPGGACVSRGGLSCPWISPGGSERTGTGDTGDAGTRCRPPPPPGGAARGAARGEPKPLRGGSGVSHSSAPPSPGNALPWLPAPPRARGGSGMGVEVGMGKLGCSCAPRVSAGAGSARGKQRSPRGPLLPRAGTRSRR